MPGELHELTTAERCMAIGRMLQANPEPDVLDAFFTVMPELREPTGCTDDAGTRAAGMADAEAIAQDYLRLFVGLGTPLAPPWESAWASDARLLFQRETLDVRYWYRSAGLQVAALHHEPDDHIGLELEFIGRLLQRGETEIADQFAREHPRTWAARWAQALRGNARHSFYPALAAEALRLLG